MRKITLLLALTVALISTAEKCGSTSEVNPETEKKGCFSDSPLERISWAKDQLQYFQKPKSGPLRVATYSYKGEDFLAFENPFVSSPMSYIFDCSGVSIGKRGINYNVFTNEAEEVKLLLEDKY